MSEDKLALSDSQIALPYNALSGKGLRAMGYKLDENGKLIPPEGWTLIDMTTESGKYLVFLQVTKAKEKTEMIVELYTGDSEDRADEVYQLMAEAVELGLAEKSVTKHFHDAGKVESCTFCDTVNDVIMIVGIDIRS